MMTDVSRNMQQQIQTYMLCYVVLTETIERLNIYIYIESIHNGMTSFKKNKVSTLTVTLLLVPPYAVRYSFIR